MNAIPLSKLAKNASRKFHFDKYDKVVFINTGDVLNNEFLHNKLSEKDTLPGQAKKSIKKGDILYSEIRPGNGRYLFVNKDLDNYVVSTKFMVIEANQDLILPEYLFLILTSSDVTEYFKVIAEARSGTFPQITFDAISHYEINTPNKVIQKEIVDYIFSLDQKIQLNTQTNQTLEQIAQAIFKSWFVDFDPVRAKTQALSEGKSEREANLSAMAVISGKAIEDLSQTEYQELWEIADAFPSELVENAEFGEVPKGWEISTIGESYNVIMGQSPSGETYNEQGNGTLFYQGRAEFGWRFPTPRLFTTNPKRMAKSNDILMSVRAPVGDLNVALENCCIGRGLCALSHKSGEFSFGFYQMKNLKSVLDVFNGEGTVFGSINQKDLKSIPVLNPHQEIIALFNKFIFDIDNKIKNNVKENQQLEKIRDLLLPKLLSGELLNE